MEHIQLQIEALIFASEQPVKLSEIKEALDVAFDLESNEEDLQIQLTQIIEKYQQAAYPFEVKKIAGGYHFFTKPIYHTVIGSLLKQKTNKRLSRSALETLSIVAYKQPLPKSEVEKIRGVSSDYSIHKLLEKELIEIVGRSEGPGKPLLYGTSSRFMDYFGINELGDLPKLREFKVSDNEIGAPAPIEETIDQAENTNNEEAE